MRLKILIPPLFIVSILILAIGYIKPDFEVMQMKQADIHAKEEAVANMGTIIANIDALNSSLDTRQEFEKLAYRYLPNTQSQEQVIDAFNEVANLYKHSEASYEALLRIGMIKFYLHN